MWWNQGKPVVVSGPAPQDPALSKQTSISAGAGASLNTNNQDNQELAKYTTALSAYGRPIINRTCFIERLAKFNNNKSVDIMEILGAGITCNEKDSGIQSKEGFDSVNACQDISIINIIIVILLISIIYYLMNARK
jgi:hypothetical protein